MGSGGKGSRDEGGVAWAWSGVAGGRLRCGYPNPVRGHGTTDMDRSGWRHVLRRGAALCQCRHWQHHLAPGENASVSICFDGSSVHSSFAIPQGVTGRARHPRPSRRGDRHGVGRRDCHSHREDCTESDRHRLSAAPSATRPRTRRCRPSPHGPGTLRAALVR
jgi:hypothetical protein